jgi:hypothetical protein
MKDIAQDYERVLARALRAPDPPAAVAPDGLRLAALLVTRLRFERLLRGSGAAEAWFRANPAAFTRAFGRYHRQVACQALFPSDEARRFERWLAGWERVALSRNTQAYRK